MIWNKLGFKGKAAAVLLAGFTFSFALVWYGTSAVNLVIETERVWADYNRTATSASQLMDRINKHLGYGGFIHNFKNYILRADDQYIRRMAEDEKALKDAIAQYQALNISDAERVALQRLSSVIDEYSDNINAAKTYFHRGQNTADVDLSVKVNDEPALKALAKLSEAALKRSEQNQAVTQAWLDETILYLSWGGVIVPLVLFSTAIMVRFLWQSLKARETAIAAQTQLEELLQSAPDAMLTVDGHGNIVRANRKAEALFGYTVHELCEMKVEDLIPPEFRMAHVEERMSYLANPHTRSMGRELDLRGLTRDGRHIPLEISLSTLKQDGNVFATATIRDISQRLEAQHRVRENEERLSLSEGIAKAGTWDWDVPTSSMFWSDELYAIVGSQAEEITPSYNKFCNFIHPDDRLMVETAIQDALDKGTAFDVKHRIVLRDGTEKFVYERGQVYRDENGSPERMIGVVLDMTEQKAITNALENAKMEADRANLAKSEFLANMSHEIRTPMNAILGMGYLAMKTELTRQQADYLNKILSSARSLLRIINDILDFSKIEAGKLELEDTPFSLSQVMEDVSTVVGSAVEDKKLEVLFSTDDDVPSWLIGDPLRLEQVLINLTNNAVKFTEQGDVVLRAELVQEDQDGNVLLKFSVRDTGIGMSPKQVENLFEAFHQGDTSTTRRFGGTGLGLSISNRLVSMMGGEFFVESEEHKGSTFSFTAMFKMQERKNKPFQLPEKLVGAPVLIVDDNETSRQILHETMMSFGFRPVAVNSGEAALSELARVAGTGEPPYEIVLMDWVMEGIDGLETTDRIRNNAKLPNAPTVIMVTAYGRDMVMGRAQQVGLDGYLLKPVTPSVLFDTLMEILGHGGTSSRSNLLNQSLERVAKVLRGLNVLVVEDNTINQQVAQEILQEAGARVALAEDGDKAYRRVCVDKEPFDAVLMDLHMPIMDGYVATGLIRETFAKDDLVIIAMTANAMRGERDKCLNVGMNDFISKPIDVDMLYETLLKWIPANRLRQAQTQVQSEKMHEDIKTKPLHDDIKLPESLDGFDVEDGLDRMLGRPELYLKFLFKLADDHAGDARAVREAYEQKDFDLAHRLAHTVKGVSGNLSAQDLYKVATDLSSAIKNSQSNVPELLDSFEKELDRAVQVILTLRN